MIQISQTALRELKRLQSKQRTLQSVVRLDLQAGGCADWTYVMQFEQQPGPDDTLLEYGEVRVAIASTILSHLDSLTIDYAEDLMGGSFRFVNPNASQTCGCGTSFSTNASRS